MHRPRFLAFTVDGLEVIEATFPGDLALELFKPIKRHSCGIGSVRE